MGSSKLYLIALGSLERLDIQFVPAEIGYNRSASYAKTEIIGRNVPKPNYSGGETTMSLVLDFYAEEQNRKDVYERVTWLESLGYADTDKKAENVKLVFGEMFKKHRWVITSIGIKYTEFNPGFDFLPHQATVTLALTLDAEVNPVYRHIQYKTLEKFDSIPVSGSPQIDLYAQVDTSKVDSSNLYANGRIIDKADGTQMLLRDKEKLSKAYMDQAVYQSINHSE